MKKKILFVGLILLAQVLTIFCLSFAREWERRGDRTFILECQSYDPRELLKGHYLPLFLKIEREKISFSKLDADAKEKIGTLFKDSISQNQSTLSCFNHISTYGKFWLTLSPTPSTGFWEVDRISLRETAPTNLSKKEIAIPAGKHFGRQIYGRSSPKSVEEFFSKEKNGNLSFTDIFPNRRFYLSEKKAKYFDKHFRGKTEHVISAEFYLNNEGTPVPKRLFVDGVEY